MFLQIVNYLNGPVKSDTAQTLPVAMLWRQKEAVQSLQAAFCVGDILDGGMSQSEAASFVTKTGALLTLCLRGCWTIGG